MKSPALVVLPEHIEPAESSRPSEASEWNRCHAHEAQSCDQNDGSIPSLADLQVTEILQLKTPAHFLAPFSADRKCEQQSWG
jgi:hypothetical protein